MGNITLHKEPSWFNYMNNLQVEFQNGKQLHTEGFDNILNINHITDSALTHSIPWIYLLDYTSGRYLFVSKSIEMMMGYKSNYFLDGGVPLMLERYHPQHMRLFNEEIFPDRLKMMRQIPSQEHLNYIFSYNFSFKTNRGDYVNLLQKNCFIQSDEQGNPLLSFGVITNVEHYKSENPIIQVVEKVKGTGAFEKGSDLIKKSYYLNNEDRLFTKRERDLLPWLADGFSSKAIAQKLFITELTVTNHKRNMMKKCNARNVTELVSFAIRHQLC